MLRVSRPWAVALVSIFGAAACPAADAPKKLNVLWIISDDANNKLGCYGYSPAKTPNIDRLAAKGVRFDRAYCQYPLCNPSRVSFLTGLRPDTTRIFNLEANFRSTIPNAVTLPQTFRKAGYYVARVGKIFHYGVPRQIGTDGMDDPASWQEKYNPRGRDKDEEDMVVQYTGPKGKLGFAMSFFAADGTDGEQTDGQIATKTIELLEKHRGEPFFIGCGFFRPHVPCVAPKAYFAMHPQAEQRLPTEPDHMKGIPPIAFNIKPPNYGLSQEKLKNVLQGYHAATTYMDAQVGRVLDAVDRLGLGENTAIVFCSDHGWLLGEHGQWQKQCLFEESARVPLVIYVPKATGNGTASPRTVELMDLYPTLTEACGLSAPTALQGKSLRPLLVDPQSAWDRPAYTQVTRNVGAGEKKREVMGRSVRTERWRYTEWDDGKQGAELYDHDADPHEYNSTLR